MKAPILLNFDSKEVLIVGFGKVGRRRAETLLSYGCRITVLDCAQPEAVPEGIVFHQAAYSTVWLEEKALVIAATDDKGLNQKIGRECRQRRILCNIVSDPDHSDFIFPSVVIRGDLTLSVCTNGASPALTKMIKSELETRYDASYAEKTALLKTLREATLKSDLHHSAKQAYLKKISKMRADELRGEVEKL